MSNEYTPKERWLDLAQFIGIVTMLVGTGLVVTEIGPVLGLVLAFTGLLTGISGYIAGNNDTL